MQCRIPEERSSVRDEWVDGWANGWVSKCIHNFNPAKIEIKGTEFVIFGNIFCSHDKRPSTSGLTTAANKEVETNFNFITRIFNSIHPFLLYTRGVHNAARAFPIKSNIQEVWDLYTYEAEGKERCKRLSKERRVITNLNYHPAVWLTAVRSR